LGARIEGWFKRPKKGGQIKKNKKNLRYVIIEDAKITKDLWNGKYFVFLGVDNIFNKIQSPLYNAEQEETAAYIYAPTTGTYIYGGIRMRF